MIKVVTTFLTVLILATSVSAAHAGGWSEGLFWWEAGAGLLGMATGFGIEALVVGYSSPFYSISGNLGNAVSVLLVGELNGKPSKNWYVNYPVTLLTSFGYPLIPGLAAFGLLYGSSYDLQVGVATVIALSTPIVTAAVYNWVKIPKKTEEPSDIGFKIRPYSTYLADSGGDLVPVCGVSVSF
jgi:hypothetical protein